MSTTALRPLLSVKQVAEILHRHEKTVLLMVKRGRISCIKQSGNAVQFTEQQVADYLAACEVRAAMPEAKPARNPKYSR